MSWIAEPRVIAEITALGDRHRIFIKEVTLPSGDICIWDVDGVIAAYVVGHITDTDELELVLDALMRSGA